MIDTSSPPAQVGVPPEIEAAVGRFKEEVSRITVAENFPISGLEPGLKVSIFGFREEASQLACVAVNIAQPGALPTPLNICSRRWGAHRSLPLAIESRAPAKCQGEEQDPGTLPLVKKV